MNPESTHSKMTLDVEGLLSRPKNGIFLIMQKQEEKLNPLIEFKLIINNWKEFVHPHDNLVAQQSVIKEIADNPRPSKPGYLMRKFPRWQRIFFELVAIEVSRYIWDEFLLNWDVEIIRRLDEIFNLLFENIERWLRGEETLSKNEINQIYDEAEKLLCDLIDNEYVLINKGCSNALHPDEIVLSRLSGSARAILQCLFFISESLDDKDFSSTTYELHVSTCVYANSINAKGHESHFFYRWWNMCCSRLAFKDATYASICRE